MGRAIPNRSGLQAKSPGEAADFIRSASIGLLHHGPCMMQAPERYRIIYIRKAGTGR